MMTLATSTASDREPLRRVGIVGGGIMGVGIAHAFLTKGCVVTLVEADPAAVSASRNRMNTIAEKDAAKRSSQAELPELMERVAITTELSGLKSADLVVEAIPEDPELKASVLFRAEEQIATDALLATNTSSISIDVLSRTLRHPGRFLGLHFFNPVVASLLVEVVRGSATTPDVLDKAQEWIALLGKETVLVDDSPGFVTSRLGILLGLEAIRMLEEGVARAEDIDKAMTLGYKHPIGPLRLTDLVGLDVRLQVADYLSSALGDRFSAPELLRQKVRAGELGRKVGRGFFNYVD